MKISINVSTEGSFQRRVYSRETETYFSLSIKLNFVRNKNTNVCTSSFDDDKRDVRYRKQCLTDSVSKKI